MKHWGLVHIRAGPHFCSAVSEIKSKPPVTILVLELIHDLDFSDMSNLRQRSGQKQFQLSNNNQLVEKGCPFHLPCQSSIQSNHHIIRNEEASCEGMHSEQRECQVSAIMSAASNPYRTRLSVKWHSEK